MPASYLQEAFGTFAPHTDKEAAVKFALDLVLAERTVLDDQVDKNNEVSFVKKGRQLDETIHKADTT